ncbi:MAG TPA: ABC transporter ATP-binding protein, partial [Eubacterium sp.]|nr:ABC transporter ATP-binding protein [Eubacterium sp.]
MRGITKAFGTKVVANKSVDFDLKYGTIVSLLGENGSGKTTLMNMLSGIYFPDKGDIFIDGKKVTIRSPHDAMDLGIGMVHQHFKLVDVFTAAENIVLGLKEKVKIDEVAKSIKDICDKYGFEVDPNQKVYDMSVAQKQTLEIVKVLYRGANVLILDEPTAVLTPQETRKLFNVMRNMKNDGKSIIIITHKLNEVLEISDEVAVLRKGEYVGTVKSSEATEASLTELMVGDTVELDIKRTEPKNQEIRLDVQNLSVTDDEGIKILDNISFKAYSGEILGVAGISGCGQKELLESIAGLVKTEE